MDSQPFDYRKQFIKESSMEQNYMKSRSPPPPYSNPQPTQQASNNTGFDGPHLQPPMTGPTYNLHFNLSSMPPSNAPNHSSFGWNNPSGNMASSSNALNNSGFGWTNNPSGQFQQAPQIHQQLNQGHLSPVYNPQVNVQPSFNTSPMSAQTNISNDPRLQWTNPATQNNDQQLNALIQQQINSLPSQSYSSQPILQPTSAIQPPKPIPTNGGKNGFNWTQTSPGQSHHRQQQGPHILQPQNTINQPVFPNNPQTMTQLSSAFNNMFIPSNSLGQNQQVNPNFQQQGIVNPQSFGIQAQPTQPYTGTLAQANYFQQQSSPNMLQESLRDTSLLYSTSKQTPKPSTTPTKKMPLDLLIDFGFDSPVPEPLEEKKSETQKKRSPSPKSQKSEPSFRPSQKPTFIAYPTDLSVDTGIEWVKTTPSSAYHLKGRAVVSSKSIRGPLWVIRSRHNGEMIPGKMFVKENTAAITYAGKVITLNVETIEVLCAKPNTVTWVPASHGSVPVGAIPAGSSMGETLYIGRGQFKLFKYLTPGKVHPSHKCCYIVFAGTEIKVKHYDVLTRI